MLPSENIEPHHLHRFTPPSLDKLNEWTKPLQLYFNPHYYGIEQIDNSKPALFVTNHTVAGLTDGLLFGLELYKRKGIFLRPLVDNFHFSIPKWKNFVREMGFVKASRENCSALMQAKENVLVFPGGAREFAKRKGEAHQLVWKNHLGFARMAIEHDYDIIPVGQVGGDDAFDIIADADDFKKSWFGKLINQTPLIHKYFKDGETLPPLTKGLFGLPGIPKPADFFIGFGDRIDTSHFKHNYDEEVLWTLRDTVELEMDKLLIKMIEARSQNKPGIFRKWFT